MTQSKTKSTEQPVKKEKTQIRVWFVALLGILILIGSVFFVKRLADNKPKPEPAITKKEIPTVTVTKVKLGNNQIVINAQGIVKAKWQSKISSQVTGNIRLVHPDLEVGNIIDDNTKLVEIDAADYLANLANARANFATAKTNLSTEKARAKQAKRDLKRTGIKPTDLALRKPQIAAAEATLDSAEASIAFAKKNIERTTIKAPFKALVVSRDVSEGELVNPGSQITNLVSLEAFTVNIPLSEKEINLIQQYKHPKVKITNPSNGGVWMTEISRFDSSIDSVNRTLSAYVDIENPYANANKLLRLESFVNIEVYGNDFSDSLWIDDVSIIDNNAVWGISSDIDTDTDIHKLKRVKIEILYSDGGKHLSRLKSPIDAIINIPSTAFIDGDKAIVSKPAINSSED